MPKEGKKVVIVTFKPKDKRVDKRKDKVEIFKSETKSEVSFFSADDFSRGVPVPSSIVEELIGYDVNRYEAPIVMASVTEKELGKSNRG